MQRVITRMGIAAVVLGTLVASCGDPGGVAGALDPSKMDQKKGPAVEQKGNNADVKLAPVEQKGSNADVKLAPVSRDVKLAPVEQKGQPPAVDVGKAQGDGSVVPHP